MGGVWDWLGLNGLIGAICSWLVGASWRWLGLVPMVLIRGGSVKYQHASYSFTDEYTETEYVSTVSCLFYNEILLFLANVCSIFSL